MAIITANEIDIRYTESGAGEPLVLIHGGQSDRCQFDVFRPLLGEGIRAIAYDQRDSPQTPYELRAYSMQDHAEDCAAFLTALGLEKAHLMGESYGGAVAMVTAISFPGRVQSLILAATTPSWTMAEPIVEQAVAELDPGAIERAMLERAITPSAIDDDPILVNEIRAAFRPRSPEATGRRMSAIRQHDCRDRLSEIQAPTLILHGDEDPLISAKTAEWTAEHIRGAHLALLPGSRHGLTFQHRRRTAELVRSFVLENSLYEAESAQH